MTQVIHNVGNSIFRSSSPLDNNKYAKSTLSMKNQSLVSLRMVSDFHFLICGYEYMWYFSSPKHILLLNLLRNVMGAGMWDGMANFISDIYISNNDWSFVDPLTTTSLIGYHDSIKFARVHTHLQSIYRARRQPPPTMTPPSAPNPHHPPTLMKKNPSVPKSLMPTPKQPMPPPPSSHCGRYSSRQLRLKNPRRLISSPRNTLPRLWRP